MPAPFRVLVPRRFLLRIERPQGLSIVCESGLVWVTQLGDSSDYILTDGQAHTLGPDGMVLVNGLHESWCRLFHASGKAGTVTIRWDDHVMEWRP